jgi:hypothetical protein
MENMSSYTPTYGKTIQTGDFVVIEYNQRQYIAGTVVDMNGGFLFLKDAHEAMSDGSVYAYRPQFHEIFEILFNDILYTCEPIEEKKAKEIKEEVRIFKILSENFPHMKEVHLFNVIKQIRNEENK